MGLRAERAMAVGDHWHLTVAATARPLVYGIWFWSVMIALSAYGYYASRGDEPLFGKDLLA